MTCWLLLFCLDCPLSPPGLAFPVRDWPTPPHQTTYFLSKRLQEACRPCAGGHAPPPGWPVPSRCRPGSSLPGSTVLRPVYHRRLRLPEFCLNLETGRRQKKTQAGAVQGLVLASSHLVLTIALRDHEVSTSVHIMVTIGLCPQLLVLSPIGCSFH